MENKIDFLKLFLLLAVMFAFSQNTMAQGRYDWRLSHQSLDCATKKLIVCLEIKATSADSEFVMGSANFPISFRNIQLKTPAISGTNNFSGGDYFTIDGSLATTVTSDSSFYTVNIKYRGENGDGTRVISSGWMKIACIQFDLATENTTGCYTLNLNRANPTTVVTMALPTSLTQDVKQGMATNILNQCPANPVITFTAPSGTTITAGQSVDLILTLTGGSLPATIKLDDNTTKTMTTASDKITVTPTATTTYTVTSVMGSCGAGSVNGVSQLKITVNNNSGGGGGGGGNNGNNCIPVCVPSTFTIR